MGISGLHPCLKPYLAQIHISHLRGCRVGIDAWSWLHRGAVGAAQHLATGERPWEQRGYPPPWVEFCLKMVAVLCSSSVTPVLVFDGCRLPAKAATNQQRRQRRQEARERAQKLLQEGREQEAQSVMMQCIDVTAEMAHELILKLRERGVDFVVAPYEADAQLAYLTSLPEQAGGVTAVVTEDSDLVAYGCRRVIFKLDTAGHGMELCLDRLFSGPEAATEAAAAAVGGAPSGSGGRGSGGGGGGGRNNVLSFRGWTLDMLQAACVLAGCDFLPSLKGISFRTAHTWVGKRRSLAGALKALRLEKRFQLAATPEYCAAAEAALLNFKHALVFCANTAGGSCRRLTPLPPSSSAADVEHLGAELEAEVARGIAYGYLHPHTLQPFAAAAGDAGGGNSSQQHGAVHQQHQQHQQQLHQQHQRQLAPQAMTPSLASQRQLGSWMAAAGQQEPQLGPSRRLLQPAQQPSQPQTQSLQQQWHAAQQRQLQQQQQQCQLPPPPAQQGADVSDVLQLYRLAPGQQQQHPQQRHAAAPAVVGMSMSMGSAAQRLSNPFARQRPGASAAQPAAHTQPECGGGGSSSAAAASEPACRALKAAAAAVADGAGDVSADDAREPGFCCHQQHTQQQAQAGQCAAGLDADSEGVLGRSGSWEEAGTQVGCSPAPGSSTLPPPRPAAVAGSGQHSQQRLAMQTITNRGPVHVPQAAQQCSSQLASSVPSSAAESMPGGAATRQQQQLHRATPAGAAATAGSKRKSSGSGKKAARALAPPAQRISRFFPQIAKVQQ